MHAQLLDTEEYLRSVKEVGESVFKNSPIHTHFRLYHSNSCDVFMSFSSWPVARSHILVILIGLSNTQIFDHDLVRLAMISEAALVNLLTTMGILGISSSSKDSKIREKFRLLNLKQFFVSFNLLTIILLRFKLLRFIVSNSVKIQTNVWT